MPSCHDGLPSPRINEGAGEWLQFVRESQMQFAEQDMPARARAPGITATQILGAISQM